MSCLFFFLRSQLVTKVVWTRGGKDFSSAVVPGSIELNLADGEVHLQAEIKRKRSNATNIDSIDLNKFINNNGGELVSVRPRVLILCFDGTSNEVCLRPSTLKHFRQLTLGCRSSLMAMYVLSISYDPTNVSHHSLQNTNVVKLMACLKRDDPDCQQVYYQVPPVPLGIVDYIIPSAQSPSNTGRNGNIHAPWIHHVCRSKSCSNRG